VNEAKPAPALAPDHFRRLAHEVVDLVTDYLSSVRDRPVFAPMEPTERQRLLEQPLPVTGAAPAAILELFRRGVLSSPMGNGHPRFFGWVNSPPAPIGVLAEFLAAAMNPSCAGGDHAAIYLERCVVRWLMELVGYSATGSMGLLTSGGSAASLIALAAARHHAAAAHGWNVRSEGLQGSRPPLVLYISEEGHSCLREAAVRTVPVDDEFRMDVQALREAIRSDRAAGLMPFCAAASAGTVSTGAIDPLDEIADVCAEQGLWFHVDGAYGAFGVLDRHRSARFEGLARADSLALDPHKWLSVPVECGCVVVRDGVTLREAFSLVPPYLRTEEGKGFGGLPWFSEYGFQQTRGFRALKVWMLLQHLGRTGVERLVGRHIALAEHLAALVDQSPDLERLAPVELSIVCFRVVPPARRGDAAALDALNKRVMEQIQAAGTAFLTGTVLRGRFALRAGILHYDTTEEDVATLLDAVRTTTRDVESRLRDALE
jgi:aromatic-L-amino-acid/L-tryptophan decarboxylase